MKKGLLLYFKLLVLQRQLKKIEDDKIIQAIKKGEDGKVFEQLYTFSFPKIKAMVRKSGGKIEDAEDVFQEAVITFMKQVLLNKYVHQKEIDAYVYVVARHHWYGLIKKNKSFVFDESQFDDLSEEPSGFVAMRNEERDNLVMTMFNQLGEKCKELLQLTIYEGLSLKEIAEKTGYSNTDTVKTKNYKCKQRLVKLASGYPELEDLLRSE